MDKRKNKDLQKKTVDPRPDLADPANGKDLSYLNEFPQFSTDEGIKGGVPPPRKNRDNKRNWAS